MKNYFIYVLKMLNNYLIVKHVYNKQVGTS